MRLQCRQELGSALHARGDGREGAGRVWRAGGHAGGGAQGRPGLDCECFAMPALVSSIMLSLLFFV